MNFPLLTIVFLLHSLDVAIFVILFGVFLDMGVVIHGGCWGHILSWRGQRFFSDNFFSLVLCHIIDHCSNEHP